MTLFEIFDFNGKLVPDNFIRDCEEQGCIIEYTALEGEDHAAALATKMIEESTEVAESTTREQQVKELGDVYGAMLDFLKIQGISLEEVTAAWQAKSSRKGAYTKGYTIGRIEVPADNPYVPGFFAEPQKYKYLGSFQR